MHTLYQNRIMAATFKNLQTPFKTVVTSKRMYKQSTKSFAVKKKISCIKEKKIFFGREDVKKISNFYCYT